MIRGSIERRMAHYTDRSGGPLACWPWLGTATSDGYGRVSVRGHIRIAHRVAYEIWTGPIPAGLSIDHLCRTRLCMNPRHMEPVPIRVNIARRPVEVRLACPNGHPYTPTTTGAYHGHRRCRPCHAAANARWLQRRRAA